MTNSAKIEAILFFRNESVSLSWLEKTFQINKNEIEIALSELEKRLNQGIVLQRIGDEVSLKTNPEVSEIIKKITKEEIVKELTPSALETLSIIIYKGPVSKRDIDYIRGVNSGFILRNLLIRGLIEKSLESEGRGNYYKPSLDLMSLLGISKIEELEEYENFRKELENINIDVET